MKDKIEVGEYVRTKRGYIRKVIRRDMDKHILLDIGFEGANYLTKVEEKEDIVKHSKNIIDLIEVGDYVNGREVKHIAMFEGFPDYPKLIFVNETHLIPDDTCENDEIHTILTKEIYMANCYKVGGEDNE